MNGGGSRSATSSPDKDLAQGAGGNVPLKPNENFQERPHQGATGFVYFVSDGAAIKIGSTVDLDRRLHGLQTSHHRPLEFLAGVQDSEHQEFELHQRFAHLRIRGEWFRASQELLDFIARLPPACRQITPKGMKPAKIKKAADVTGKAEKAALRRLSQSYKDKPAITWRVKILLSKMKHLANPDDDKHAARLRAGIVDTTESLAQVLRDGGETFHRWRQLHRS